MCIRDRVRSIRYVVDLLFRGQLSAASSVPAAAVFWWVRVWKGPLAGSRGSGDSYVGTGAQEIPMSHSGLSSGSLRRRYPLHVFVFAALCGTLGISRRPRSVVNARFFCLEAQETHVVGDLLYGRRLWSSVEGNSLQQARFQQLL